MTERAQIDLLTFLSELEVPLQESETAAGVSSESDPDISAVLLESINKAQEASTIELTPEDDAFVNSCLAFNSDDDWEFMKVALLDALNAPNSGSLDSSSLNSDEEMLMVRESDGENAEWEFESRENIFGIWNLLDLEDDSGEEIGLIKDLEEYLSSDLDFSTSNSTVVDAEGERLNLKVGGQTVNVEELVADLGNLSLNPVEGWNDKIL